MAATGKQPRQTDTDDAPDSPAEIAESLRSLSAGIGADSFHLYLLDGVSARRLVSCLDSAFPGMHPETERLPGRLPWRFADIVAEASHPLWWGEEAPGDFSELFSERVPAIEDGAGLVLPLCTEQRRLGVVFFLGSAMRLTPQALFDIHNECHASFAALAELFPSADETPMPAISKRELQCLKLTANGLTSEDIARRLGLSVHTANQYLASTTQKLNAVNRVHAVAKALRIGLID